MAKKHFELDYTTAVPMLNRQAESVQRAAEAILGVSVPLVVFDCEVEVPPEHQLIEGVKERTPFGIAMTPQRIKIHPRELITLANLVADNFSEDTPNQELLRRVDFQILRFLVMKTVEEPAQGREDFRDIVRQTFSIAFNDWTSKK